MLFDAEKHKIFETVAGSHVYGTNTPESDTDYRGIVIPPKEVRNSLFQRFDQHETKDPDRVLYSLAKFMKLAVDCNPSILEFFFIDKKFWVYSTPQWAMLKANVSLFLSTKARHTFSGYGMQQLHRLRRHEDWIANPLKEPNPGDYGLSHDMLLGKDEIGSHDWLTENTDIKFSEEIVRLMSRAKAYKNALVQWKNYKTWRENRNKKRAELEEKCGYDCKHAYHLVRLVRLGEEILKTGHMTLYNRPDQEELVSVRNGEWPYKKVLEFAQVVDEHMKEWESQSPLPHSCDRTKIDKLYQEILATYR